MPDSTDNAVTEVSDLDSAFTFAWDENTADEDNENASDVEVEDEVDSPDTETEDEVVESDEDEDEETDEVSDAEESDDEKYVVKVDGEEIEVTLDELAKGYQRQADYTRKTQALAAEREELAAYKVLAEALQDDPEAVVRAMAERFGVNLGSSVDNTLNGVPLDPDDPTEGELLRLRQQMAEMERKLGQTEAQRQQQYEEQRKAEVFHEIESIKERYNDPDLDPQELLQFAVEKKVGDLEVAYTAMKAHKPEPPTIRKLKAKRSAPPVAGGGHRAGVKEGSPSKRMSLEDALAEAISAS